MATYHVEVQVMPRPALLDPQGKAVQHALTALGFGEVDDVRMGKAITMSVQAPSPAEASERVRTMCERLLANPVTEDFEVTVGAEL